MDCWSEIPSDLLCKIVEEKVKNLEDIIRIKAVCKNWRRVLHQSSCLLTPHLPWLMLPYSKDGNEEGTRDFFTISEKKVHHIDFQEAFDDDKSCVGSSHGWLVLLEKTSLAMFLLNSFTKRTIQLPSAVTFVESAFKKRSPLRDYFVKFAFSCDPNLKDCIVVVICNQDKNQLAFCKVGDQNWTFVVQKEWVNLCDVVHWKGKFYSIGLGCSLWVFDFENDSPNVVTQPLSLETKYASRYLVVDSVNNELLLVLRDRIGSSFSYRTTTFEVCKLDQEKQIWKRNESLGMNALFLCHYNSLCFPTIGYPGCTRNTIYFSGCPDLYDERNHHMRILYIYDYSCTGRRTRFRKLFRFRKLPSFKKVSGCVLDSSLVQSTLAVWLMPNLADGLDNYK